MISMRKHGEDANGGDDKKCEKYREGVAKDFHNGLRRNSTAFIATITVDSDMKIAATAGSN